MKREFFLQDDKSNKFWTVEVQGACVVTGNGRIGAKPRETRTEHASAEAAAKAAEKEILGKLRKGYTEGKLADVPAYSKRLPPKLVRINHDDYKAKYVGRTKTGDQFFLTFPFAPSMDGASGGNYVAMYLFDAFGALKQARIFDNHEQGIRTQTEEDAFAQRLLADLGGHKFGDIKVAPFVVQSHGRDFGLVFDPGDEEDDDEDGEPSLWVTVEPGNYMAFYPPWDGEYDT